MEFDDFPYIGNRFTPTDELHHLSEGDENDPESVGVNSGINRALSENVGKSMQNPFHRFQHHSMDCFREKNKIYRTHQILRDFTRQAKFPVKWFP
jgi:hypothetical protein